MSGIGSGTSSGVGNVGTNIDSGSSMKGPNPDINNKNQGNVHQGMPTFNPNDPKMKSDDPNIKKGAVIDEFRPEGKDDNMMAENDPIKREPENWQKGIKKDPY